MKGTEAVLGLADKTVQDFWVWAYSDILVNTNRSCFAEFLVGSALDVVTTVRVEWDAFDLKYCGTPIEVKTSAYVQSWPQTKPSSIRFDIEKKKPWFAESNTYGLEKMRSAELYVFCLLEGLDRAIVNPLEMEQWSFFVVSTDVINMTCGNAKSIGLNKLKKIAKQCKICNLRDIVDSLLPMSKSNKFNNQSS